MNILLKGSLIAAALGLAACARTAEPPADETTTTAQPVADTSAVATPGTIVDVASNNPEFGTLFAAIQAGDLTTTLSDDGPYTVFAPTDAAFEALPAGRLEALTKTRTDELGKILTYHVVEGRMDAQTLIGAIELAGEGGYTISTVNGAQLVARVERDNVVLTDSAGNTATVTATDIDASNGVLHAIDAVMMPS